MGDARRSAEARRVRDEFSALLAARGHAVDNVRAALALLETALADGTLHRTDEIDEALADARVALAAGEGQKLGGKSAEAARFIGRRLERLLAAQS